MTCDDFLFNFFWIFSLFVFSGIDANMCFSLRMNFIYC